MTTDEGSAQLVAERAIKSHIEERNRSQPLQVYEVQAPMSVTEVVDRVQLIQKIMHEVMKPDTHYGVIPGTGDKKSLLKAGAEKLGQAFRLAPEFRIERTKLEDQHREYEITCRLTGPDGKLVAEGVANCSTMESKYRYRNDFLRCPECQQELRKSKKDPEFYCWAKIGGCGATFPQTDPNILSQKIGKIENPDVADTYNTVLKMAKKRAHIDAIITATACSDLFVQDLEEGEPASPITGPGETRTYPPRPEISAPPPTSAPSPTPRKIDVPSGQDEPPMPQEREEAPMPEERDNPSSRQPATAAKPKEWNDKGQSTMATSGSVYFIAFTGKPDETIRDVMKKAGYKYNGDTHEWHAQDNKKAKVCFDSAVGSNLEILDRDRTRCTIGQHTPGNTSVEGDDGLPFDSEVPPPSEEWASVMGADKISFLNDASFYKQYLGTEEDGHADYYKVLGQFSLTKSNHIHPDDADLMFKVLKALKSAKTTYQRP